MIIKDYNQLCYDILKPLALEENPPKIFRNSIDTDFNSQPLDYIVYSTGISDVPRVFGDGVTQLRRCNCDITVNEAGNGNRDDSGHLVKRVEELLVARKIAYTKTTIGYIEASDSIQTNFDFYLM